MTLGPRSRAGRREAAIAKEVLPPGVFRSHGALYFITTDKATKQQTWHRLGVIWSEAAREWKRLVLKHRSAAYARKHLYLADGGGAIPTAFLREMLMNARKNAKARGLECTLTLEQLQERATLTGGRCELTGITFEYGRAKELEGAATRRARVWAPSLDRLDGAQGYTDTNVRIVCMAVNIARQEFGDEVLFRIAAGLGKRQISSANRAASKAPPCLNEPRIFGTVPREASNGAA